MLSGYDAEVKAIREELLRICWFMRGSISYSEAAMLGKQDREIIAELVKKNLETAKESNMPFW